VKTVAGGTESQLLAATHTDLHIDFCTTKVHNKYPVYVFTAVVIS